MHEFGGAWGVTLSDYATTVDKSAGYAGTWFEYGAGLALQTGKNNHIYFDVERTAGSDYQKDWQWNAGARRAF